MTINYIKKYVQKERCNVPGRTWKWGTSKGIGTNFGSALGTGSRFFKTGTIDSPLVLETAIWQGWKRYSDRMPSRGWGWAEVFVEIDEKKCFSVIFIKTFKDEKKFPLSAKMRHFIMKFDIMQITSPSTAPLQLLKALITGELEVKSNVFLVLTKIFCIFATSKSSFDS